VQAGLLALDLACIPRQEAFALEDDTKLGVGLDERPGDAVTHRAGLAADASAVNAHPEVVRPLGSRCLEGKQCRGAVRGAREVILERPPVDPGLPIARAEDHPRDGRLALTGSEVLSDVCHQSVFNSLGA
jgi:hypothetical protein